MKTAEMYLFRVSIDEEDYAVFSKNAREAIDIAFKEVEDFSDLMDIEVKLLCFENDIINLKELTNK
jgi:hypothetical protein